MNFEIIVSVASLVVVLSLYYLVCVKLEQVENKYNKLLDDVNVLFNNFDRQKNVYCHDTKRYVPSHITKNVQIHREDLQENFYFDGFLPVEDKSIVQVDVDKKGNYKFIKKIVTYK